MRERFRRRDAFWLGWRGFGDAARVEIGDGDGRLYPEG